MDRIINIAGYQFMTLGDLVARRDALRTLTASRGLRGTILLSTEGLNLSIAGRREDVDAVLAYIRAIPGVGEFLVKETYSDQRPFNRMLVKIKREIIAFGVDGIDPAGRPSKRVRPSELKQWLDDGRPITLLDTRNQFEVDTGTFDGAVSIGIDDFRDFPKAVARLPEELKRTPVVTFCTGGIRCEKAAPFLEQAGFTEVYQLDGGILDYFKQCSGAHYHGDCFVFDQRVALDPNLNVSGLAQCFACQAILTADERASVEYVIGKRCPRCDDGKICS